MALPLVQSEPPSPEEFSSGDGLESSRTEQLGAQFKSVWQDTAIHQIGDIHQIGQLDAAQNQKTLSIDELNGQYPGMTWTEPKKANVAKFIADRNMERQKLQETIASGPQGSATTALGFGAGLAAHLLDPLELATFAAGGELVEGANIIRGAGLAARLGEGALGGIAGQVPLSALKAASDTQQGQQVTAGDVGMDVGQAAVGGAILHAGIGFAKDFWGSPKAIADAKLKSGEIPALANGETVPHQSTIPNVLDHPSVDENLKAQAADGRSPNPEPFQQVFERERVGPYNKPDIDYSGRSNYEFRPIDAAEPVSGKFYIGTNSHLEAIPLEDLKDHPNAMPGKDFGTGTYMVDDPHVANGYAASSFNEQAGAIHELNLKDAKLLSASEPAPFAVNKIISDAIKDQRSEPIMRKATDQFGSGPKLDALPEKQVELKNGKKITIKGRLNTENVESEITGRELKSTYPGAFAVDESGKEIGRLSVHHEGEVGTPSEHLTPAFVHVEDSVRRMGVASEIFKYVDEHVARLTHSEYLSDMGREFAANTPPDIQSTYEMLRGAPNGILDRVNESLRQAGYDGIHFVQESSDGARAHNGVMVFDGAESKLTKGAALESDPSLLKGLTESEKSYIRSAHSDPSSEIFHDPKDAQRIHDSHKLAENANLPKEMSDLEGERQATYQDLDSMHKNGYLSDALKKSVDATKEAFSKLGKNGDPLIKSLMDCIGAS